MPGQIFITGGSGFVGSATIQELLQRGYSVRALVHGRPLEQSGGRLKSIQGDLFDMHRLVEGVRGCDTIIHLVGIIQEKPSRQITFDRIHAKGTESIIEAALRTGVKRYIHMSAMGARVDAASEYHKTKFKAEQFVKGSGLEWTIFRPSLIHGPKGDFMRMEAKWARRRGAPFLFMPYFGAGLMGGGGAGMLQPVYVGDVAKAFVDAVEKPRTAGKIYSLCGPEAVTWPELHRICAEAIVGHRRWVAPIPVWWARLLTTVMPGSLLPFNRDQIIMSQENNTCDLKPFEADFGWTPHRLAETLATYAKSIR